MRIAPLALSLAVIAAPLWAQTPQATIAETPARIIETRQTMMDLQDELVDALKDSIAHGTSPKASRDAIKALVRSGALIAGFFPVGTETGGNTRALPAIWSDTAGFQKAASDFTAAATKLAASAEADDKAGFVSDVEALGKACGTCHRAFRARRG